MPLHPAITESGFTAIVGWAADVPAELLARLYGRCAQAPSKATIWRVVTGADATALDAVIGAWLAKQSTAGEYGPGPLALVAIAVDGKTVRGATDAQGNQVHLLAAATHTDALVLARSRWARKPTRSPCSPHSWTGSPTAVLTWPGR